MSIAYILYNPKESSFDSFESVSSLKVFIEDEIIIIDVTKISDYRIFINGLEKGDYIIVAGGDGTLNRFLKVNILNTPKMLMC